MASLNGSGCCTLIRDVFFCVHDANSDVRRLTIDIEDKNYKCVKCRRDSTRRLEDVEEIIASIIDLLDKLGRQVLTHQGETGKKEVYDALEPNLVSDPCQFGLDMLLKIRLEFTTKLAHLQYHNGKREDCDIARTCFPADEMSKLTGKFFQSLKELQQSVMEHSHYCPGTQDQDSGISEGGYSGVDTQRHAMWMAQQEIGCTATEADQQINKNKEV